MRSWTESSNATTHEPAGPAAEVAQPNQARGSAMPGPRAQPRGQPCAGNRNTDQTVPGAHSEAQRRGECSTGVAETGERSHEAGARLGASGGEEKGTRIRRAQIRRPKDGRRESEKGRRRRERAVAADPGED